MEVQSGGPAGLACSPEEPGERKIKGLMGTEKRGEKTQ